LNFLARTPEMETTLRRDVLGVWFPRTVDKQKGGFYSNFTREWQRTRSDGKFAVFQGRMIWLAAQIVMRRPDLKDQFLPVISHGLDYLGNVI
jgi:mannose/cellobiose epimerase-like protein (N-acyl-D-glucosamine 2-epimerase family)